MATKCNKILMFLIVFSIMYSSVLFFWLVFVRTNEKNNIDPAHSGNADIIYDSSSSDLNKKHRDSVTTYNKSEDFLVISHDGSKMYNMQRFLIDDVVCYLSEKSGSLSCVPVTKKEPDTYTEVTNE